MEYVTTGLTDDLDTRIKGFPRGELSVITGDAMLVQQSWVNEQVRHNDAPVVSSLRPSVTLERQLPDGAEYYAGEVDAGLEEVSFDTEALVIESNDDVPLEQLMARADENDIAVVLITTNPSPELVYTASVVLDVEYESELTQNLFNMYLMVKKHAYTEPSDMVLSLEYKPEPFVEKRKKA